MTAGASQRYQWMQSLLSPILAIVAAGCFGFSFYFLERSTYAAPLTQTQSRIVGAAVLVIAVTVTALGRTFHRRLLFRVLGLSFASFAVVFGLSELEVFRKTRYFAEAGVVAACGVVALIWLMSRGARKAHQRASIRPTSSSSGKALGAIGLALAAAAVVAIFFVGRSAQDATRPAILVRASAVPRGVIEVFCLDDQSTVAGACREATTVRSVRSTYRIGDAVLMRRSNQSSDAYQIVIAPKAIPLLVAVMVLLVGVGFVISGVKRRSFSARLAHETASLAKFVRAERQSAD